MADQNFVVKNGLTVNSAFVANSTGLFVNANTLINYSNTSMFTYAGNSTFNGSISFSNAVTFSSANVTFSSSPSFTGNAVFSGTNTYFTNGIRTSGNTGIGVDSPAFTLDVGGTFSVAKANVASIGLTDATTINWNASLAQVASVTLGGNRTIANPTNLKVGSYILHVIQDGTGNRTVTWGSAFKWPAGVAPVLTTTANRRDLFSFVCDGTNLYGSFLPDVR